MYIDHCWVTICLYKSSYIYNNDIISPTIGVHNGHRVLAQRERVGGLGCSTLEGEYISFPGPPLQTRYQRAYQRLTHTDYISVYNSPDTLQKDTPAEQEDSNDYATVNEI